MLGVVGTYTVGALVQVLLSRHRAGRHLPADDSIDHLLRALYAPGRKHLLAFALNPFPELFKAPGAERATANAQGITFTMLTIEEGVTIEADRHVLSAVLMNLLQNAFKFTQPHTTLTLRVDAGARRGFSSP
jgi:signal transduction histidine kinase